MTGTKNKKKKSKKKVTSRSRLLVILGVVALLLLGLVVYVLRDLPNPSRLGNFEYPESTLIYDRNNKLLYELFTDKKRFSIKLEDIPKNVRSATLAIEDAHFYSHKGFDIGGLIRGLYRTVVQKRLQGGSTLTQQLVKNGLLSPERTISRKIKEAILTMVTEIMYSKDQILEMYLNQSPYGGTLWGVGAAARGIFNKDIKDLNLAESALIAGLTGSPTRYSPFTNPELAKKRQELVLSRMEELKMISKEEKDKAIKEKLNYYLVKNSIKAPHFVFYVKDQLINNYGAEMVAQGGLKVTTSLDLEMQNYAQNQVASEAAKLVKQKVGNGAVLITKPDTGEILTMVGSKDYFSVDIDGKYNITTASRQPGSSIKPLNYAVALESGKVTAASVFLDQPTCFQVAGQKSYCPTNYGNAYHGIQSLRNSLGNSLNIPAVKVLKLNTVEAFVASASALGINSFKNSSDYGLSLTLGGGEVQMTEMNVAFGVFANSGNKAELQSILKVVDRRGKVLEQYKPLPGKRILSRETSYLIQNILSDDGARSMVFGRGSLLSIKGHPEVAVKTGTTNDLRDNWTIGFTQDYVVSVWVGNNDNSKMSQIVSGTTGAAPIWSKVMSYILKDKPSKSWIRPNSLIGLTVCNLTGQLVPDEGCDSRYEYFKAEFAPNKKTPLRRTILIDKDNGLPVQPNEIKTNVEFQDHIVVEDATNTLVCLDCTVTVGSTASPIKVY